MGIENYRTTPALNGTVLATGTMSEGMSPGLINDSMRQICSDIRTFYNDPFFIEFGVGDGAPAYTRVNGTSFTLNANVINDYHTGRRIKLVDGTATTLYGTITSSSFNSPNTTVNVSWDGGVSIGSGTITSVKLGLQAVNSPAPSNVNTGGIIMWTTATVPDTWLLCDGSLVSKTAYASLWNLIGSTYGTPTATQFYLPNLADKFVIGKGSTYNLANTGGVSSITPTGTNSTPTFSGSSGSVSGSVSISGTTGSHTLTVSQIPSHSHFTLSSGNGFPNQVSANGALTKTTNSNGGAGNNDYVSFGVSGQADQSPSQSIGGGAGHSHSFSGSASISGGTTTPSGTVSAPTFTGNSTSVIPPYIALSYIIKT